MPDTGAPWNIPYVAGTDLVSDWPTDSLALANAIDAGLDAAYVGIGTNVVQAVKTNTFTLNSSTFADVTGLSVAITPTTNTAKVLILVQLTGIVGATNNIGFQIVRDSTAIGIADAAGNRTRATISAYSAATEAYNAAAIFLDSPATTSATTYKVQMLCGASVTIGINSDDADLALRPRSIQTLTAIEVAA